METLRELLVISGHLESRKALLCILEKHPVLVFATATIEHAREVLAVRSIELVFSEENFVDGTYRDLLKDIRLMRPEAHFVLMLCTGDWEECVEGMGLGAWDVLRCPLVPTDVEFLLSRSARERAISCTAPTQHTLIVHKAAANSN